MGFWQISSYLPEQVPANKFLFTGIVPANKFLFAGTVRVNNLFLKGDNWKENNSSYPLDHFDIVL